MIPGWILVEELVQSQVEAWLATVFAATTSAAIDELLALVFANLPPDKRAQLKAWLTANDLKVVLSYPRAHAEVPCVAIILDPEQEDEFVGETGVTYLDGDTERATAASKWTSTIGVLIYAENGQLACWLAHLIKFGLSRSRRAFNEAGGFEMHLSSRDFGIDPRFAQGETGRLIYRRAVQLQLAYLQHDVEGRDEITDVTTPDSEDGALATAAQVLGAFND